MDGMFKRKLRERARDLRFAPLDVVLDEVEQNMSPGDYEEGLPDYNLDQFILKLAMMKEIPSSIEYDNGSIVIDTSMGQYWFIHDGAASGRFVVDQVL